MDPNRVKARMRVRSTSELSTDQKRQIFTIWNEEYPEFLAHKSLDDFESFLEKLENAIHYLAESEDKIIGWVSKFDREGSPWFSIIISSQVQGKGIGSILMNQLKAHSDELNGWVVDRDSYFKVDGEAYRSPMGFYIKNGFEVTSDRFVNDDFEAVRVSWTQEPPVS